MKMWIVYDASAKALESSPLLNDQFETGPYLQNLLWDVLVRNLFRLIALSAYVKQVFVQVRIQSEDRDSLRFHWIKNKEMLTVKVLRFTWALFGLVQSPFLGATIYQHMEGLQEKYPSEVGKIERSLYVDDIISGGETRDGVCKLKGAVPDLEENDKPNPTIQSYTKDQLGVKPGETKLLGLPWDKVKEFK